MRSKFVVAVLLLVFGYIGVLNADIFIDNFTAFGTVENCSYGASIDGDYAAVVDDEGPSPLYYYHFPTKTLTNIGLSDEIRIMGASLKNMQIAYIYQEWGQWSVNHIAVFNILTRETIETGVATASGWDSYRPMRFFDGDRIMYTDKIDGRIKYYSISTQSITDTGLVGWDPIVDGDILAFSAPGQEGTYGYKVAIHNLRNGTTKIIDSGFGAVVAGNVVAYIAGEGRRSGEVKYYRLDSEAIYSTGFTDVNLMSTDGLRIAIAPGVGSIKVYEISTGATEDTGAWPCTGGWPCWLEIEGRYIAYERYEGGFTVTTDSGEVVIPEEDLNGDGYSSQDCAGGWFISEVNSPIKAINTLIQDLSSFDIPEAVKTSLVSNITASKKVLEDINERNDVAAANMLSALINSVEAQSGITISKEDADRLHAALQDIINLL